MAKVTASEFAKKWGTRLKASTQDMIRGANKVTVAPSSLAVAQIEKMKAKLLASIEDGTWARQLSQYSLEDWKKDFTGVGVQRISGGVDKAEGKMTRFGEWLIPRVEAGQTKVDSMPSTSLEDNIARMTTFVRHMAEKKYKKGE